MRRARARRSRKVAAGSGRTVRRRAAALKVSKGAVRTAPVKGSPKSRRSAVLVDLALQGGGSHGAFTWGVLDRLLEVPWLKIDAISGSSAGAMNAAVLASGWISGGASGAREALDAYWERVATVAAYSPLQRTPLDRLLGRWTLDTSPAFIAFDLMARLLSPYDLNPHGFNPLEQILNASIDFAQLARSPVKLFVTATSVRTGRGRIFRNAEITPDVLLASACLPTLFQAVEIDGEPYWDGGYMGNPALFPLFYETMTDDILLVQINPLERRQTPRTAREIHNRLNEITFNSNLLRELRAVAFVKRLIDEGKLSPDEYKDVHLHRIDGGGVLDDYGASSKSKAQWDFFLQLRDAGRSTAQTWLAQHYQAIGVRGTLDLQSALP